MKLGGGCLQQACLFSWISTLWAYVSHNEMSIVIPSELLQPFPAFWLRPTWAETLMEQHSVAQLEFMSSYSSGLPVRSFYSLHAGRYSDITIPWAGLVSSSYVQSFYSASGQEHGSSVSKVRQVNSRFLSGICICERKSSYAPEQGAHILWDCSCTQMRRWEKGRMECGRYSNLSVQLKKWFNILLNTHISFLIQTLDPLINANPITVTKCEATVSSLLKA